MARKARDSELVIMTKIFDLFKGLDEKSMKRILKYIYDRYEDVFEDLILPAVTHAVTHRTSHGSKDD